MAAVRSELGRMLRDPSLRWFFLACALPAASFALALPPGGSLAAAAPALDGAAAHALLQSGISLSAAAGALRMSNALSSGVFARDVLSLGIRRTVLARFTGAAAGGAALALVAGAIGVVAIGAFTGGRIAPDGITFVAAIPAGIWGGVWGALMGTIVRAPLLVIFAAVAPLLGLALVTADRLGEAMPVAAVTRTLGVGTEPSLGSAGVAIAWLALLSVVAGWSGRFRPLL